MTSKFLIALSALVIAMPVAAFSQGIVGGAEQGARDGNNAAGPVGGVVGGVVGAVGGGIAGLLGVDQRPRFREYVVTQKRPAFKYDRPVVVGAELPRNGVTYYEVPAEYGVRDYRYTVVNDRTVLVDPRTGRIVEVLD
jgi:hypothetical protein